MLHEKLDHLIMHNKELIEIQKYKSKRWMIFYRIK
jgi:hypothetical protein